MKRPGIPKAPTPKTPASGVNDSVQESSPTRTPGEQSTPRGSLRSTREARARDEISAKRLSFSSKAKEPKTERAKVWGSTAERAKTQREKKNVRSRSVSATGGRYFTSKRAALLFANRADSERDTEATRRRPTRVRAAARSLATRIGIAVLAVVVLGIIVWGVFFSPVFEYRASNTTITGTNQSLTDEDVLAALTPYDRVPLPRLSTQSIVSDLESLTWVESATVSRDWPHGLSVAVTPRTPALTANDDGVWVVYDRFGVELLRSDNQSDGLTVLSFATDDPAARSRAIEMVMAVRDDAPTALMEMVASITADGVSLTLHLDDGRVIKWGDASQSALKGQVVSVLLEQRPAQVYDVSTPTRPMTS